MPRVCSVCAHPARVTIDDRLEAGQPLRDIAGQYTLSKSALDRHKTSHIPVAQDVTDIEARFQAARQADQWHYKQLRWNARAVMRAMQGWDRIRSPKEWDEKYVEAREHYHSGRFVLERLGAERFLDPQLMAILWQLRQGLIKEYGVHSPSATMLIDLAVMTYHNAMRIQGWIGDLALWIEHECFAQEAPQVKVRREYGAQAESLAVEDRLRRLSEQLIPVFERVNRQLNYNLKALAESRHGPFSLVAIGQAEQVNVVQQQVNAHIGRRQRRYPNSSDSPLLSQRSRVFTGQKSRAAAER